MLCPPGQAEQEAANPWHEAEQSTGLTYTLKVGSCTAGPAGHSYHSLSTLCDQIIVIGDAGVGKTSLIHQLTKQQCE